MSKRGNAFRGLGIVNARRNDFAELRNKGRIANGVGNAGWAVAAGAVTLAGLGVAAAVPIGVGAAVVGGVALAAGAYANNAEGLARAFGAKGITDEDKEVYVKNQGDLANALSAANTAATKLVRPKPLKGTGVKAVARADLAKSLSRYKAKQRNGRR